jgi:hypothetical protein
LKDLSRFILGSYLLSAFKNYSFLFQQSQMNCPALLTYYNKRVRLYWVTREHHEFQKEPSEDRAME